MLKKMLSVANISTVMWFSQFILRLFPFYQFRFTDLCRLAASLGGLTVISGLDAVWVEHVLVC